MLFIKNRLFVLSITVIILIAAFIRLYALDINPPHVNWDEASLGYNAYSILKTGHDEWGNFMPMTFKAFGEYKLPGYIYTAVPFVALFGLNEFAVRLPSALFGTLTVLLVAMITYRIVYSRLAALYAGAIMAVTPWHFFVSRSALEANLALFLIVLATYLLIEAMRNRPKLGILSLLSFALAIYTYNSTRIFVPLYLITLIWFYRRKFFKIPWVAAISLLLFLGLFATAIPFAVREGSARLKDVTILDQGAINRIEEARNNSSLPDTISRVRYNRAVYFVEHVGKNYITYFSPNYLFITGGSQFQFSMPNFQLLYIIQLPFIIAGLITLIKQKHQFLPLIIAWVLLAPLPAAITRETPHVLRSLNMFIPLEILGAIGFAVLFHKLFLKQRLLAYIFSIFIAISIVGQMTIYFPAYATTYPKNYSCTWQYGYKQVYDTLVTDSKTYDAILMTKRYGEPHAFLLFFSQFNARAYYSDTTLIRYEKDNHAWVDRFGKFYFVNDWELQQKMKELTDANIGSLLVITSPNNYPKNVRPSKTITFLNGDPVFEYISLEQGTKISQDEITLVPPERGCRYK